MLDAPRTICEDGWISDSVGAGTCSWHGGIADTPGYGESFYPTTGSSSASEGENWLSSQNIKAVIEMMAAGLIIMVILFSAFCALGLVAIVGEDLFVSVRRAARGSGRSGRSAVRRAVAVTLAVVKWLLLVGVAALGVLALSWVVWGCVWALRGLYA